MGMPQHLDMNQILAVQQRMKIPNIDFLHKVTIAVNNETWGFSAGKLKQLRGEKYIYKTICLYSSPLRNYF